MKRLPWIPRLNRLHIHAAELGNSRGNISHLGKELAGALLPDQGIKNAEAQAPEACSTAGFGYWGGDYLLLAPEVGYVVFSASFGLCCFLPEVMTYIISRCRSKKAFFTHIP